MNQSATVSDGEHVAGQRAASSPAMAAARVQLERAYVELSAAVASWSGFTAEVWASECVMTGAHHLEEGDSAIYDAALELGEPFVDARDAAADALGAVLIDYALARQRGGLLAAVAEHLAGQNGGGR
jgi:hypothetical protein